MDRWKIDRVNLQSPLANKDRIEEVGLEISYSDIEIEGGKL